MLESSHNDLGKGGYKIGLCFTPMYRDGGREKF